MKKNKNRTSLGKMLVTVIFMGISTIILYLDLMISPQPTLGERVGLIVIVFLFLLVVMSGIFAYLHTPKYVKEVYKEGDENE